MIFESKTLVEEIKQDLKLRATERHFRLAVLLVGDNLVSARHVERKRILGQELGIEVSVFEYPETIKEEDLCSEISRLNDDQSIDGIIVQLPLPRDLDQEKILNLILPVKDVDALSREARVLSPTIGAIKEILNRNRISLSGKSVVVLGRGRLVGKPAAIWFTQEGSSVTIVDSKTSDAVSILKQADIIVSGVGQAGLIKPSSVKEGAVLIDAGTSEAGGQLRGDADPACAEKCSLFTPVPGGVGPLTVVMLFKNLFELSH